MFERCAMWALIHMPPYDAGLASKNNFRARAWEIVSWKWVKEATYEIIQTNDEAQIAATTTAVTAVPTSTNNKSAFLILIKYEIKSTEKSGGDNSNKNENNHHRSPECIENSNHNKNVVSAEYKRFDIIWWGSFGRGRVEGRGVLSRLCHRTSNVIRYWSKWEERAQAIGNQSQSNRRLLFNTPGEWTVLGARTAHRHTHTAH